LNFKGRGVVELYSVIDFFAEPVPVYIHERIRAGHLPDNIVGDPGAFSELRQVQLSNPAALADVMNQVKSVAFAPKKCHISLLAPTSLCSVRVVHYGVNSDVTHVRQLPRISNSPLLWYRAESGAEPQFVALCCSNCSEPIDRLYPTGTSFLTD